MSPSRINNPSVRREQRRRYYDATAFRGERRRWSKAEDALIMSIDKAGYPGDRAVGEAINRSMRAIQIRRSRIRSSQVLCELDETIDALALFGFVER